MSILVVLLLILLELILSFFISINSYYKHGYTSLLYDSLTSLFFILGLLSELASFFLNTELIIFGKIIFLNSFLRTLFIVLAFLFWIISINYLTSNQLSQLVTILAFISGAVIISSLFETDLFSSVILVSLEILGMMIAGFIIGRHFIFSMKQLKKRKNLKNYKLYLLGISIFLIGFTILILNGLLVYRYAYLIDLLDFIAIILIFTGFSLIMSISAIYPTILATTYVKPYSLFLVTKGGETFFEYIFNIAGKKQDPELIGSAMTGISMMTSEIIGKDIPMKLIEHEAFYIIMAHGEKILGFLFTERFSRILFESLEKLITKIETKYSGIISDIVLLDEDIQNQMKNDIEEAFYYLI